MRSHHVDAQCDGGADGDIAGANEIYPGIVWQPQLPPAHLEMLSAVTFRVKPFCTTLCNDISYVW